MSFKAPLPVVKPNESKINETKEDEEDVKEVEEQIEAPKQHVQVKEQHEKAEKNVLLPEPMTDEPPPAGQFRIEIMKNGCIIENKELTKQRIIFGRQDDCDIIMNHPSISRYHAALLWSKSQAGQSFWYLVDLGSTHGTTLNKELIESGKYYKIIPNNNLYKFGASTRMFTLCSDQDDEEEETEESQEDVKVEDKVKDEDFGCDWGFHDDHDDQDNDEEDGNSLKAIMMAIKDGNFTGPTQNDNAYQSNPLKTIQQWFEREGYDFEYKIDELHGKFKCQVDLPIDGQWIPVEGKPMTKKKESINDASLKACQLLDRAQLLFPWQQQQSRLERRKRNEDSDSDDDLIDETGSREKKKAKREALRKQEEGEQKSVDNFESLTEKWNSVQMELAGTKARLAMLTVGSSNSKQSSDLDDDLDSYMKNINSRQFGLSINDKIEKSKIRIKIKELEKEQFRIEKLIKLAKPSFQFVIKTNESEIKIQETKSQDTKSEQVSSEGTKSQEAISHQAKSQIDLQNELQLSKQNIQESEAQKSKSEHEIASENKKLEALKNASEALKHAREDLKYACEAHKLDIEAMILDSEQLDNEALKFDNQNVIKTEAKQIEDKEIKDKHQVKQHKNVVSSSKVMNHPQSIASVLRKEQQQQQQVNQQTFDSDYVDWLPPMNQAGDGKTHLNQKYGY